MYYKPTFGGVPLSLKFDFADEIVLVATSGVMPSKQLHCVTKRSLSVTFTVEAFIYTPVERTSVQHHAVHSWARIRFTRCPSKRRILFHFKNFLSLFWRHSLGHYPAILIVCYLLHVYSTRNPFLPKLRVKVGILFQSTRRGGTHACKKMVSTRKDLNFLHLVYSIGFVLLNRKVPVTRCLFFLILRMPKEVNFFIYMLVNLCVVRYR